ncbi:vitamin B12-binding protein precursor [mine drainage metagenome]|uniref:Vitamin B12-binding protein n=1 Tax=mine drainage metagenome TaxID=410659 RepID=A0A1J5SBP7_9ZZZZ
MRFERSLIAIVLLLAAHFAHAGIAVHDDAGQTVRLAAPARRIVSLAPHITENLYAAGAGAFIVGVVDYSDYPAAAKKLPRVGGYDRLDLESILALKPDLVIAWDSGNQAGQLAKLKALGLPLFVSRPLKIDDIATDIARFGELAGTSAVAVPEARAVRARVAEMRARYAKRPPVRAFYQIWNRPLVTVNGEQLISDVMRLCGADNVFAGLSQLAPTVSIEAVLAANPEAIIASGADATRPEWLDRWKRWKDLTAVARGNLFFVPPDLINRPTPRVLEGARMLCNDMETVRGRRPVVPSGKK